MGEIAEMFLDGFLDEETGEVIDGDAPGYPRSPSRDAREWVEARPISRPSKRVSCPTCGKRFKTKNSMMQHGRDAHGNGNAPVRTWGGKVPANPDAPGLRILANEALAAGLGALPLQPPVPQPMSPAQQYTDPMCILQDALPILDVLIEDREALHGERDPIARDLRARIRKVVEG